MGMHRQRIASMWQAMRRETLALLALMAIAGPTLSACAAPLHFIAIGDTPYSEAEAEHLRHVVAPAIQQAKPIFVTHYGDFKSGGEACSEALAIERRRAIYDLLPGRVFYTPGDNEWTDCDRAYLKPPASELEQLDLVRRLFFSESPELPDDWAYVRQPNFPENARWIQQGVLFATVHLVSTNNGRREILLDDIEMALALVEARDQANRAWLEAAFAKAQTAKAKAVVIVTQADVTSPDGSGACTAFNRINCDAFAGFRGHLIRLAGGFRDRGEPRRPVLLVHGDTNPYCLDNTLGGEQAPNLWRLNAWGDFQSPADATAITVQPDNSETPFAARTLLGHRAPVRGCGD